MPSICSRSLELCKVRLAWYGETEKRHSNGWELTNSSGSKAYWTIGGKILSDPSKSDEGPKFTWPLMLVTMEFQRSETQKA